MKYFWKLALLGLVLLPAQRGAAVLPASFSASWTGAQVIPDNNAAGVAFTFNLPAGNTFAITEVAVDLTLSGGWNGDLYAYLSHDSGFAVLLNRVGRSVGTPDGSGVSGLNIHLADQFLNDIHLAAANPLLGNFAPDGRFTNPFTTLDTDARTATLSRFTGLNPSGDWTLFIADVAPLATATLQSWAVNISVAVPEPSSAALAGAALALISWRRARRF